MVDRVVDRIGDDRLAGLVDRDPAVAVVAGQRDERRAVAERLHQLLVLLAARPDARADQAGGVVGALDHEAVAVARIVVVVAQARLRRAPPGLLVGAVHAERRRAGVQAEVVAGRRAADARAQQQRGGVQRAAGDDDPRRVDRHRDLRAVGAGGGRPHARARVRRARRSRRRGSARGSARRPRRRRAGRSCRCCACCPTDRRSP